MRKIPTILFPGLHRLLASWLYTLLIFLPSLLWAQETDSITTDISKIRFYKDISRNCLFAAAARHSVLMEQIPSLPFDSDKVHLFYPNVPAYLMEKTCLLNFILYNSEDTTKQVYFSPGYYCRNLAIYKESPGKTRNGKAIIPDSSLPVKIYGGSKLLTLKPGERSVYYASFDFIRTNTNNFLPHIIESDYMPSWLTAVKTNNNLLEVFTYLASGIMMLMIFYSLAAYLQNRNKEFIYYSAYTFCSAILLFLKSYLQADANNFNYFYEEWLDFIILGLGVYFYLIFVREFINTKEAHPFLDRLLKISDWTLVALLAIYSAIYFFTDQYVILYVMENHVIKGFLFVIGITFIVYSLKKKDPLLTYLAAGNAALLFFSLISLGMILFGWKFDPADNTSILNRSMLYYEIGLVLELTLFLSGLAYKNRRDLIERVRERERLKLDNERKEFEKQMAVIAAQQEERNRISADMHDELGSGMTAIRLMSEIVKTKMKEDIETFPELEKISNSANDLLGKMNTIVWTMKSSNDTLESLIAYLRAHALEYFENTPILCNVSVPQSIPPYDMSGEKRRNIFLSVKEALNNALKHSHASTLQIDIQIKEKKLIITVSDNGIGINMEKLRQFGNGLSNMKRRMESINGQFEVVSQGGSRISFSIPV